MVGLRGEGDEEESEEEEEEVAEEEKRPKAKEGAEKSSGEAVGSGLPPMPINDMLRFTMTGNRPGG